MTFVAGGALKPIGGHILSHSSATRMFLRKGKKSLRMDGDMTRMKQDARLDIFNRLRPS
ncbi:hypothetical protein HYDPIDRAFT_109331 [Hydnomerulius pinastri MD-312]|nr:hypothetical protein HYDPIDRAFT_109331 [Hydnomerulius pinastri MD-312]